MNVDPNRHAYNTGIIGNCSYIAHVNDKAEVTWMCWPHFDSSFVFGNMLDKNKGGVFGIYPKCQDFTTKQYYVENTNVLCTEFYCQDGSFKVTDFAPRFGQYDRRYKPLMLMRKIEPLEGSPIVKVICDPRGDYGNIKPQSYQGSNHIQYRGLEKDVRLTTNISLGQVISESYFIVNQPKYLALTWGIPLEAPLASTTEDFLRQTVSYWRNWIKSCKIKDIWQEEVIRSVLVLKIHQADDSGAIIASSTTSLSEHDQSTRNWDYRFCWMRDAYYTLKALNLIGHFTELERYSNYIHNIAARYQENYNPVYSIYGTDDFEEKILDLDGYLNNKPVRIGNQAKEHIQNDVYGQILTSMMPLYVDKRLAGKGLGISDRKLIMKLLDYIDKTMDDPDAGLWEFRNKAQRHCYTFLFHWAGACAAHKIARVHADKEMAEKAEKLIEEATVQIERCYKPHLKAYTQAIETDAMDASMLQLITMGYLNPDSQKAKDHLKALEDGLMTEEGLFYRYLHADDFGKPKSTFLVCTFWYIEALACVGRVTEAYKALQRVIKYANHLGLFSEDVDPVDGGQWGNFPQTYSHVGLVNAVFRISAKIDKPEFL